MDKKDILTDKTPAGLLDVVGDTPLVELPTRCKNPNVRLFGKLEGNNPGSSVKDRAAAAMITGAEQRGELKQGMTLIEPTSGNTGIALAMIAAAKGYPIELVMPVNSTAERVQTMRAFGATVILTPAKKSMEGAIDYAHELANRKNYFMLDQFSNRDNPKAHYETTGPEIWRDTEGKSHSFCFCNGNDWDDHGRQSISKRAKSGRHHCWMPTDRRFPHSRNPPLAEGVFTEILRTGSGRSNA